MIIVTGATGQLGGMVVERLLTRVPAEEVGISVRDPSKAGELAAQGVRVRHGDFSDPSTLATAFDGATQALIVSVDQLGDQAVARHGAAIDAARRAGAERILYTSHMGARPDSPFAAAPDHAATEAMLAAGGVPYIALRNGFYANTARMLVQRALQSGTLVAPEAGAFCWTAPADLAEAAAAILTAPGAFDGPTPPLAPTHAVTMPDLAAIATEVHGREITHRTVTESEYLAGLIDQGTPAQYADMFIGMFRASRSGDFAADDPTLEALIGRPPTALKELLATPQAGPTH